MGVLSKLKKTKQKKQQQNNTLLLVKDCNFGMSLVNYSDSD